MIVSLTSLRCFIHFYHYACLCALVMQEKNMTQSSNPIQSNTYSCVNLALKNVSLEFYKSILSLFVLFLIFFSKIDWKYSNQFMLFFFMYHLFPLYDEVDTLKKEERIKRRIKREIRKKVEQ